MTAPDPERPLRVGEGPVLFSTCTALVSARPAACFDVHGYYAMLGVDWRAGTGELRRAYQRLDGQGSALLTYALKLLLDPARRLAYDRATSAAELDDPRVDRDARVQEAMFSSLLWMAAAGDFDRFERLKAELDLVAPDAPGQAVDQREEGRHDDGTPPGHQENFEYGYYRWRSSSDDTELLNRWQALLVRAASERGLTAQVAVGIKARTPHHWVHAQVGFVDVIFIDERHEPDEAHAAAAAELIEQLHADRIQQRIA